MVYLNQYQFLPLNRTVEAVKDLTEQKISEGTIVNACKDLYNSLTSTIDNIKNTLINSDVIHCDESGVRSEGKTKWIHVASNDNTTYYEIHDKRGYKATSEINILPKFTGTMVHDHWKPLYKYTDCTHAECNAHNIRYLIDIHQNYKQCWAEKMMLLLIEIHRRVENLKHEDDTSMDLTELDLWKNRYDSIIIDGIKEDDEKSPQIFSAKGKLQKSKALKLLLKLKNYDIETLAFMYDFNVPFDNNQAERDLRMQKLRQKVSGCFRSNEGAKKFFSNTKLYIYS